MCVCVSVLQFVAITVDHSVGVHTIEMYNYGIYLASRNVCTGTYRTYMSLALISVCMYYVYTLDLYACVYIPSFE